ncbi:MAG TPA: tRNA (adenosine(37)-N6)-threonylcarbamoyltransferase complex dimerization subunit type 1 TsaB, partial [Gemmatimonadaceae bacterium]
AGTVLVIETSTEAGSVAIARDGDLVAETSFMSREATTGVRTEALAPAVARCLAAASLSARDVTAVVCDAGPGGFTSLRSAAALAKGMCFALGVPLFAVSSLEVLAWSAELPEGSYIAALHAGRNEWFSADVQCDADGIVTTSNAQLVSDDELRARADRSHVQLVGPGLDRDAHPRAASVVSRLSTVLASGAVDLDLWEPAYGRLAEAQVKWEAAHGRPLTV